MATVTGMTAEKILELLANLVESAQINDQTGVLTLTKRDGSTVTAGNVELDKAGTINDAVSKAYPVGAIFMSTSSANPATTLGIGTWSAWGTGRVPVAVDTSQTEFNTVEKTGGAKTVTLTATNLPTHTHSMSHDHSNATTSPDGEHSHSLSWSDGTGSSASNIPRGTSTTFTNYSGPVAANGSHSHSVDIPSYSGSTGSGSGLNSTPFSILPPYITCYMWKRTA